MEEKEGLSVVICSIDPNKSREVAENIKRTSGVDCEFIIIDNRERGLSISQAYNEGASKAKYDYLLFSHEDIEWLCASWAPELIKKLKDPSTGVIGMAGSDVRLNVPSPHGWCSILGREITNYICYQRYNIKAFRGVTNWLLVRQGDEESKPFKQVVTLDGMTMFVRKNVWEKHPFDEKMITGFHAYDIDFSLVIHAAGFKNYIYTDREIFFLHKSWGSFNLDWYETSLRFHNEKWTHMLPAYTEGVVIPEETIKKETHKIVFDFLKKGTKIRSLNKKRYYEIYKELTHKYGLPKRLKLKLLSKFFWYRFLKESY